MAGAPPLVHPPAIDQVRGRFALVHYGIRGDPTWHARLLLGHVTGGEWVILTPDGDIYAEDLGFNSADIADWRIFEPGGPIPPGIDVNHIHQFNPFPDQATMTRLLQEGEVYVSMEKLQRGLPLVAPPPAAAPVGGGAGAALVAAGPPPAVGPPNLAGGVAAPAAVAAPGAPAVAAPANPVGVAVNPPVAAAPAAAGCGQPVGRHCRRWHGRSCSWRSRERRCKDFEHHKGLPGPEIQGVPSCIVGMQRSCFPRLAHIRSQNGCTCSSEDRRTWWITHCPFSSMEDSMQVPTRRQACSGPRDALPDLADDAGLRSTRCNEYCVGRTDRTSDTADRGAAQDEVGVSRGCGRVSSLLGFERREQGGHMHLSKAVRMDGVRNAEGSGHRKRAPQGARGTTPLKEAGWRQGGQVTSHFEAGSSIGTASSGRSCKGSSWPSFLLLTMFCFFHTGLAGVADDFDRPRNVLPLPDLSGDAGGGSGLRVLETFR